MDDCGVLPEIQGEYDVWNLAPRYWVKIDAWGLAVGYEREFGVYKVIFFQRQNDGCTTQALCAVEPPGAQVSTEDVALRLARAHGIEAPDWLAPSLHEMLQRMDASRQ